MNSTPILTCITWPWNLLVHQLTVINKKLVLTPRLLASLSPAAKDLIKDGSLLWVLMSASQVSGRDGRGVLTESVTSSGSLKHYSVTNRGQPVLKQSKCKQWMSQLYMLGLLTGLGLGQNINSEPFWMTLGHVIRNINNFRSRINLTTCYVIFYDKINAINGKTGADSYGKKPVITLDCIWIQCRGTCTKPISVPLTTYITGRCSTQWQDTSENEGLRAGSVEQHLDQALVLCLSWERHKIVKFDHWETLL